MVTGKCECTPDISMCACARLHSRSKLKAVDFTGIFLALGGTVVLILGLTWGGGQYPWSSAHVIASLVVGFAVCVAFVLWQWKGPKYPLVPRKCIFLSLIKVRR